MRLLNQTHLLRIALSTAFAIVFTASSFAVHDTIISESTDSDTVRVLTINIWQEGTSVPNGFEQIADVIAASNADIVCLTEVRNYNDTDLHTRLIEALKNRKAHYQGHRLGESDVGLLSKFPIQDYWTVDGTDSISAAQILCPNNQQLTVYIAHLDYRHYALYGPRGYSPSNFKIVDKNQDGKPDIDTNINSLQNASAQSMRMNQLKLFLSDYDNRELQSKPVLFAGDFNAASHHDWTDATKNLFDHNGVVIEWPETKLIESREFIDSWRSLYPDPTTHPGHTWPARASHAKSTSWTPLVDERDRIDFIFTNQLIPTNGWLVGSKSYWVHDKELQTNDSQPWILDQLPWPTDHLGVMIEFKIHEASDE